MNMHTQTGWADFAAAKHWAPLHDKIGKLDKSVFSLPKAEEINAGISPFVAHSTDGSVSLLLFDSASGEPLAVEQTPCHLIFVAFAPLSMDIEIDGQLHNITLAPGNAIGTQGRSLRIRSVEGGQFLVLKACPSLADNLAAAVSRVGCGNIAKSEISYHSYHHTGPAYLMRRLLSSEASQCGQSIHAAAVLILTEFFQFSKPERSKQASLSSEVIAKLDKAINKALEDPISIDDLARYCDLPVSKFSKLFKAATGYPPYQYVLKCRIEAAQKWLRETNMTIAEIAYGCGFSSQAHMTSTFSRALGVTPKQCRLQR